MKKPLKTGLTFLIAMLICFWMPASDTSAATPVTMLVDAVAINDSAERGENATFKTLGGALSKADSGDTIKLASDIALGSRSVLIGKNIIIDLNGKNLTGDVQSSNLSMIELTGTAAVEITDTSAGAPGKLDAQFKGIPLRNKGTGQLAITRVTVESADSYAIYNESTGSVTISGATIASEKSCGIYNAGTGTVTLSDSRISSYDSGIAIRNLSTGLVDVTNSTVSSISDHAILNDLDGTVNISGGAVSSEYGYAVYNFGTGTAAISNCTVSSKNNGIAVCNYSTKMVTISDTTVSSVSMYAIYNGGTGSVVFTGGEATASNYNAMGNNGGGSVTISGGRVFGKTGAYVSYNSGSTLNISGGEISSDSVTIGNPGGSCSGTINVSGGTISTSAADQVCMNSISMTLNVSGGLIQRVKAKEVNVSGDPTLIIRLQSLTSKKVTITGPLTGGDGNIKLSGESLAISTSGTAVATAGDESHAVVSKFSLLELDGKSLMKSGSSIVLADYTPPPPPSASSSSFTVTEGGIYSGMVSGTGDGISYILQNVPLYGSLTSFNTNGSFTYSAYRQSALGFVSSDHFTFFVRDSVSQESNTATVSIVIEALPPPSPGSTGSGRVSISPVITAEQSKGGVISIAPDKKAVTIVPEESYVIVDVIIDGISVGPTETAAFTDSKSHTIKAIFVKESALPFYLEKGERIYIGFSLIAGHLYQYIAPEGEMVEFRDNPKKYIDNTIPWAKPSINFVTERELFIGTSQHAFSPNESMTRAMFVTVIGRLYERSYGRIVKEGDNPFVDVDPMAYYARYVEWANEKGIIKGLGNSMFAPEDQITREQMAVIIENLATVLNKAEQRGGKLSYGDSSSISSWAISGALYCQETNVMTGKKDGNFAPLESATRAEAAAVIERFIRSCM